MNELLDKLTMTPDTRQSYERLPAPMRATVGMDGSGAIAG
jgi:hypothetical protein